MGRRNRVKRPKKLVIGRVRARAVRGPRAEGEWYWQAVVYEDGKERTVWTGWAKREDAERQIAGLVASEGLDRPREPQGDVIETVRDLMECWMGLQSERADLSPRTVSGYLIAARHVAAVLGEVVLDRADLSTVERYRDERLRAGAATGTVKMELGVL